VRVRTHANSCSLTDLNILSITSTVRFATGVMDWRLAAGLRGLWRLGSSSANLVVKIGDIAQGPVIRLFGAQ